MRKITQNLKLASYDDLFKSTEEGLVDSTESQVLEIPIDELHEFKQNENEDVEKMIRLLEIMYMEW